MLQRSKILIIVIQLLVMSSVSSCKKENAVPDGNDQLTIIAENLLFAEGPAYLEGNLYFTDIEANRIYSWNENEGLKVFMENTGMANGLFSDSKGNLVVCEGGNKRIVSVSQKKAVSVLTDKFGLNPYNEPNDLWISPSGNIYFTDPVFSGTLSQDGQHVYCITSSTGNVTRVINDLVKPNGIIGTLDGSKLYVADYGASIIYQYTISPDGSLSGKKSFAPVRADGLSTDSDGNIYAASESIMVFNQLGVLSDTINIPGIITNLTVVETNNKTAYITTHNAVYKKVIH
jgi:gluconolactonase